VALGLLPTLLIKKLAYARWDLRTESSFRSIMGNTLGINSFALRQVEDSRFSHFSGTNQELLDLVANSFDPKSQQGYRPGVFEVPVNPENFFVVQLEEGDILVGKYEARREGETPRKVVTTPSRRKSAAGSATIILYSSAVLAEDGDNAMPAIPGNYEIISINCDLGKPLGISPEVLMHNHFHSDGGTETGLSDSEFVALLKEAFVAHRNTASCG
jgi:hypothetical protein